MISRLKGPSITETETNMRGHSSKMNLMARSVNIDMQKVIITKETSIMAGFMARGSMLSLMALNTPAIRTRAKSMESESLGSLMEALTKAAMKKTSKWAQPPLAPRWHPLPRHFQGQPTRRPPDHQLSGDRGHG